MKMNIGNRILAMHDAIDDMAGGMRRVPQVGVASLGLAPIPLYFHYRHQGMTRKKANAKANIVAGVPTSALVGGSTMTLSTAKN